MNKILKHRKDVDKNITWDLTSIYKTEEDYNLAIQKMIRISNEIERDFKGMLNTSININKCLDKLRELNEIISCIVNYANLAIEVDHTNNKDQERFMKCMNVLSDISSKLSFIDSEIIQCDDDIIDKAIIDSKENNIYLSNIKRKKPHALHPEVEKTLAALLTALESPYNIYNSAKLADMHFDNFNVNGEEYPLSFGTFEEEWEYESDTNIRRAAFKAFSSKLKEYENTIASAYQTQVQNEKTISKLRGFDSVIDSLLFDQHVSRDMYNRQIDLIMEKLAPHMRKYAKLLKKIHNLDEMTFADLKIPVDPTYEPSVTIEDSKKYILNGLSVLGDDYLDIIKQAYNNRWIDFPQNKGKCTGAFCSTPYGSHPFVLISWTGKMKEVFTLAHELGHAGHFSLCNKSQSIFNTDVSTYFVESPSTMNEILMAHYLVTVNNDPRFKRWVLSSMVGHTYYHNFVTHLLEAAYQREVYKIIDEGGSVQADTLNKIKKDVLEKFWGEDIKIVDGAELTWMRQPHYYMGLYSYTYSAGLTIATEVSKRILNEGQEAVNDWRNILEAGGTKTPVELSKMAKIDITTEKPLIDTIDYIGDMIDEIIKLTDEINN